MDYSKTINLLQTAFPMKADLPKREPLFLKKWEDEKLYEKIQAKGKGKPVFLLHDGPPYANGVIHMGHALNKILKDFVVKYKTLAGYQSPYKPGWDCHGLPIEHQLFKEMGKNKHQVSRTEFREKATQYALGFVDKQREDFKRLGVLADWGNPYLTLANEYEAGIVETFFHLRNEGFVYKGLKPGYWCGYDETALAEAEVEYADKKSDSVYVRFPIDKNSVPAKLKSILSNDHTYILIWTTTPWTLPANRGLAFHPDESYVLIKKGSDSYVLANKLKERAAKIIGATVDSSSAPFNGKDIEGLKAKNPLAPYTNKNLSEESRAVTADYVTMDDGTGIVHIAPGHGMEDFAVGQKFGLETISPVNERGMFDDTICRSELKGKHVLKDANKAVMELLGDNLVAHQAFTHSYPHCWRCKNPIIFRATEQWFLRVDDGFRKTLLNQIDSVTWEPAYGIHRIKGMVEQRPDWCLSRQRHWGAPIAVLNCKGCKEPLNDAAVNKKIVELISTKSASAWYDEPLDKILSGLKPACAHCKKTEFEKEMDILDVWFDSGVSWYCVVKKNFAALKPEKVMYLEGSESTPRMVSNFSLIPSVALQKKAPYDIVLTHGFVMDGQGHKMSKSLGNVIAPQEIIEKYGADILRLWVAMSDYRDDVRLSQDILNHVIDMYRRFRNTFRFLLQNTSDFSWDKNHLAPEKMEEIDRWILANFEEVKARVLKGYEANEFHVVLSELNRFVAVQLSGFYLDALKDRLYCEAPNSPKRRSAQTSFCLLTRGLTVLLAPLLSFTSEETFMELKKISWPNLPESVFLDEIKALPVFQADASLNQKWLTVLDLRSQVNDILDKERKVGVLKSSQEALLHLNPEKLPAPQKELLSKLKEDWPFVFQMSEVHINGKNPDSDAIKIEATKNPKCERCWRHRGDVGTDKTHPTLCGRCVSALSSSGS